MILCDVNVLIYAMMERSPHHALCKGELEALRRSTQAIAISETILAGVVRIATNPRIFRPAAAPAEAFEFVEALGKHPNTVRVTAGERHWPIFRELVLQTGIRGGDTTDAYLAAIAMEHDCEWWTTDAGFERFVL